MAHGKGNQSPINITKHLKGIDFPAEKADLLDLAEENGADEEAMEKIRQMPDKEYGSMADVMKGFGETD